MNPGLMVKLRPTGPWRIGPDSGARNQVDLVYHSDSLYAAITTALLRLGILDEWLTATARNGSPAVCFSSCFPFVEEIGFVIPPRTVWPPSSPALLAARVRWKSARFIPLGIVQALLAGQSLDENQWAVDGASGCLAPVGRGGPFRTGLRFNSAVDRLTGSLERHSTACLEFRAGAGLWTLVSFADQAAAARWLDPLKTAFRLLADSGFGGERSRGWGRSEMPEFVEGTLPDMVLGPQPEPPALEPAPAELDPELLSRDRAPSGRGADAASTQPHWLLSLFTPAATDSVDWERGHYSLVERGGRIESAARFGELKKQVSMIEEGSVLYAAAAPRGCARDVAPDGFTHPVFRAGFAVSIPLPEVR
jgi:CRISPR type III-A-associated RAMP protein Csm4